MKRARFVAAPRREFLAEVAYYSNIDNNPGARFTSAIEEATRRAIAFPLTGSPTLRDTRRMFVKDFPFAIVYRPVEDGIVVFAIAHHARRPGYWQSRIKDAGESPAGQ